jgi:hypothetical protein
MNDGSLLAKTSTDRIRGLVDTVPVSCVKVILRICAPLENLVMSLWCFVFVETASYLCV